MARQWRQVSLGEAKQHPLYGVKNWLAVFAFGVLLIPLRELGSLTGPLNEAGLTLIQFLALNDPFSAYAKGVLTLQILMASVIFWLLFSKHRKFRVAVSSIWLGYWPAVLLIALVTRPPKLGAILGETLGLGLISWSLSCLVWVTYLQRSRRVRITFENCVLIESVQPAEPLAQPFPTLLQLDPDTAERSVSQLPGKSFQSADAVSTRGVASTAQVGYLAKFGPWIFGALCLFFLWFNIFWGKDSAVGKPADAVAIALSPTSQSHGGGDTAKSDSIFKKTSDLSPQEVAWQVEVAALVKTAKAEGLDYVQDTALQTEFDNLVRAFGTEAAERGMSDVGLVASKWALYEAHNVMKRRHTEKLLKK